MAVWVILVIISVLIFIFLGSIAMTRVRKARDQPYNPASRGTIIVMVLAMIGVAIALFYNATYTPH